MQIMKKVQFAQDKTHLMRIIDQVSFLSEFHDDNDIVDVLCYIITKTEDPNVRFYALDILLKFKGR